MSDIPNETPLPRSEAIIEAIVEKLGTILPENGYQTDAGRRVFRGRRTFNKNELPAISVFDDGETNETKLKRVYDILLRLRIEGHVEAGQKDTARKCGLIKADIKQCLGGWIDQATGGDITYTGAQTGSREDGASTEWAAPEYTVRVAEVAGDPYSKPNVR